MGMSSHRFASCEVRFLVFVSFCFNPSRQFCRGLSSGSSETECIGRYSVLHSVTLFLLSLHAFPRGPQNGHEDDNRREGDQPRPHQLSPIEARKLFALSSRRRSVCLSWRCAPVQSV